MKIVKNTCISGFTDHSDYEHFSVVYTYYVRTYIQNMSDLKCDTQEAFGMFYGAAWIAMALSRHLVRKSCLLWY